MRRLFGISLGAVVSVMLLTLVLRGNEFELRDKHWECLEVDQGYACRLSITLVNLEQTALKLGLRMRGLAQGEDGGSRLVLEQQWFETLAPQQQLILEREFVAPEKLQRVAVMATAMRQDMLE